MYHYFVIASMHKFKNIEKIRIFFIQRDSNRTTLL